LTNAILLGSLLEPLGLAPQTGRHASSADVVSAGAGRRPPVLRLGELPLARRDVERLRQILSLQRRLADREASPRAKAALTHRSIFREALTWLEIHGDVPEVVEHWNGIVAERGAEEPAAPGAVASDEAPAFRPRRRRRRRRFRPAGS
jgi:hypothetical protein